MCIRDRMTDDTVPIPGSVKHVVGLLSQHPSVGFLFLGGNNVCLLYTSDAADELERCPSRGLGDVYKRQDDRRYSSNPWIGQTRRWIAFTTSIRWFLISRR